MSGVIYASPLARARDAAAAAALLAAADDLLETS